MHSAALVTLESLLRTALAEKPAQAGRLVHGRGRRWEGLEQLSVDWLEGVIQVTLFRQPEDAQLAELICLLQRLSAELPSLQDVRILLQHRYQHASPAQWITGEPLNHHIIHEDGLGYALTLGNNQNNGLFLDMRNGRRWVRANSQGKRVLNLFAYTCGFSLAAIEGGAEQVVNLDMARGALSRGRDNHRLNQHDLSKVSFLGHELFKSWGKVNKCGPYDLIIIDPPSFQKGSFELERDYSKILRRLPELLTANGQVLACINDPAIGPDFLIENMQVQAPTLRFLERLENPAEFTDIDANAGLKALLFQHITV